MPRVESVNVTRVTFVVALTATIIAAIVVFVGSDSTREVAAPDQHVTAIESDDAASVSTHLTRSYWNRATLVVAATPARADHAAETASDLGVPLLIADESSNDFTRTLSDLDTEKVLPYGEVSLPSGVTGIDESDAESDDVSADDNSLVVAGPDIEEAALTSARVAGADIIRLPDGDPRDDPETVSTIEDHHDDPLVTVAGSDAVPYAVESIHRKARQPGGGYLTFGNRRLVALYGHPGTPSLGALGQQSVDESLTRVTKMAEEYDKHGDKSVVPSLEIIATVAISSPGPDDTYSNVTSVEDLEPWVSAARDAGAHVILDLQPGKDTLLEQAKKYAPLLKEPHVGLALDPEWSLGPDESPLQQIGSVDVSEINDVADWLAKFTREHRLPQKPLVVHQFQTQMIADRGELHTSHPELAMTIHVDGQGSQGNKQSTWRNIRADAPKNVHWGWKNFYEQDEPMLTVAQTWHEVDPHPDLITYQ